MIKEEIHAILKQYCDNNHKMIQPWPVVHNYGIPVDLNDLIQQDIDIVYSFGGDGTLLGLIRELYVHYKSDRLPYIAAFNSGSLGYLCNFQMSQFRDVLDATVFN